jgi:hypothetical protein
MKLIASKSGMLAYERAKYQIVTFRQVQAPSPRPIVVSKINADGMGFGLVSDEQLTHLCAAAN